MTMRMSITTMTLWLPTRNVLPPVQEVRQDLEKRKNTNNIMRGSSGPKVVKEFQPLAGG